MKIGNCTFFNISEGDLAKKPKVQTVLKWRVAKLMAGCRMRGEFGMRVAEVEVHPARFELLKSIQVPEKKNTVYTPIVFKLPSEDTPTGAPINWSDCVYQMAQRKVESTWLEQVNNEIKKDGVDTVFSSLAEAPRVPRPASPPLTMRQATYKDLMSEMPKTMKVNTLTVEEKDPIIEEKPPVTEEKVTTSSWSLFTPFEWIGSAINWLMKPLFWLFS